MLVAQWQDGVTRKDTVQMFSFEDIKKVKQVPFLQILQHDFMEYTLSEELKGINSLFIRLNSKLLA